MCFLTLQIHLSLSFSIISIWARWYWPKRQDGGEIVNPLCVVNLFDKFDFSQNYFHHVLVYCSLHNRASNLLTLSLTTRLKRLTSTSRFLLYTNFTFGILPMWDYPWGITFYLVCWENQTFLPFCPLLRFLFSPQNSVFCACIHRLQWRGIPSALHRAFSFHNFNSYYDYS